MRKLNFQELLDENRQELLNDKEALEKIEIRIEEKALQSEKK